MGFSENDLIKNVYQAKQSSKKLSFLTSDIKNKGLINISESILDRQEEILSANGIDYEKAKADGMVPAMLDRLMLSIDRLQSMAQDVRTVAALPDPVGEIIEERDLPNGLHLIKKRVPLGVIGAIYESRPNVTVDISALCLKSGNACILRGGKESLNSNRILANVLCEAVQKAGVPENTIQFVDSPDKFLVDRMLKMKESIDLIIPRGGAGLIQSVIEKANMPVITGGIGVCHAYVDTKADFKKAVAIAYNAKVQRPTVCNALDALLVHKDIAAQFLPLMAESWGKAGVEMHCDERSLAILKGKPSLILSPATGEDWGKEFLALIAAIKVVDSLEDALNHIATYGSGHSEAIITEDKTASDRFLNEVDAACVYSNASTRFTDGGQFGLGAEIGISTQKFHARGPMALREITSYKWIIIGNGQIRP
jgi:glutamate-5-semialdehyde dehydrogenase